MEEKKCLEISTPVGKLIAEVNPDPDYPGIFVSLERPDGTCIDLSTTEVETETGEGHVFIWGDTSDDDYTSVTRFSKEELLAKKGSAAL